MESNKIIDDIYNNLVRLGSESKNEFVKVVLQAYLSDEFSYLTKDENGDIWISKKEPEAVTLLPTEENGLTESTQFILFDETEFSEESPTVHSLSPFNKIFESMKNLEIQELT